MKTETENKSVCIFRPIAKMHWWEVDVPVCPLFKSSSFFVSHNKHSPTQVYYNLAVHYHGTIGIPSNFKITTTVGKRRKRRRQWDRDEFGVAQMNNRRMIMESWHNCHCLPEIENCPLCLVQETRSLFIIRSRHISPKTDPRFSGKRQARNTTSCVISGSKVHPSVCVCVYLRMFGDVSW